jgi:aerobic-type carbon monoxide dehydrogenase small subunit (CoxS/CutS family)
MKDTHAIRLRVNGHDHELVVEARRTLADMLRHDLGYTGTHLGCEHGICGACTVILDGSPVRACLVFGVQADGASVRTVEGLAEGPDGELSDLQQAFSDHHALQCGFCTPGFLLSAYDLLRHYPGVTEEELPAQLSGVLCRCTGYRNILAAVADVGRTRDVPGPLNCPIRSSGS